MNEIVNWSSSPPEKTKGQVILLYAELPYSRTAVYLHMPR